MVEQSVEDGAGAAVFADMLHETEAALRKAQLLLSGDPVRQHPAAPTR